MCSLNQVNCWKLLNNKTISRKVKNKSSEAIHLTFINLNDNIVQSSSRVDVNTKIIYLCLCTDITLFSFIQVSGIKNKMRFNSFSVSLSMREIAKGDKNIRNSKFKKFNA